MRREYRDNGAVYRITVSNLYADGHGHYMQRTYGPYSSLTTAHSQATRLYREATTEGRKADVRIERAETTWAVVP